MRIIIIGNTLFRRSHSQDELFLFVQIVAVFPPEGRNIRIREILDALMDKGEGAEVEIKSGWGGQRKPEAEWTRS